MEELSEKALVANTDAYKSFLQREVDELKETISQNLEGTGMSLDSLGIADYDISGDFSISTIHSAVDTLLLSLFFFIM